MNRQIQLLLCFALVLSGRLADCHAYGAPPAAEQNWPTEASRVKMGMTRGEVEKIFPPWTGLDPQQQPLTPPEICTLMDNGQAWCYWVSPDWRMIVSYDFTGGENSSSNQVISPVRFEQKEYVMYSSTNLVFDAGDGQDPTTVLNNLTESETDWCTGRPVLVQSDRRMYYELFKVDWDALFMRLKSEGYCPPPQKNGGLVYATVSLCDETLRNYLASNNITFHGLENFNYNYRFGCLSVCTTLSKLEKIKSLLPPVPEASSPVQYAVSVPTPTRLKIERKADAFSVAVDTNSYEPQFFVLGTNGIIGSELNIYIYPEGQSRPLYSAGGELGDNYNTWDAIRFDETNREVFTKEQGFVPKAGEKYVVEAYLEMSETEMEVPMPLNMERKPLLERTLKQIVE